MRDKTNILIVDDEALLRQGVKSLLEKERFVGQIHEAQTEAGFHEQLAAHSIDLILLDVRLRETNGLELLKRMSPDKNPKVIAVTGLDGTEVIIHLLKAGVRGIVYKLDGYAEILRAIETVMTSGSYFPHNILKIIQSNAHRWDEIHPVTLSFADKELLKAIATGATTKEIASDLKMSPATTETYRVRLLKKLGVANTAELLAYAFRNGIL